MKKIFNIALATALIFSSTSCDKLTDLDPKDPNSPGNASAEQMLDAVLASDMLAHSGEMARLTGLWSGYFVGTDRQYITLYNYQTNSGEWDNAWATFYSDCVGNAKIIQSKCTAPSQSGYKAVAMIIECHAIGTVASLWGDVPFTQVNNPAYPAPAFENQTNVYNGLLTKLDDAIALLATGPDMPTQNMLSARTASDWTKVANSLKARYYLHLKQYPQALNSASLGISTVAGSFKALFPNTTDGGGDSNPYLQFAYNRGGYMSSSSAFIEQLLAPDAAATGRPDPNTNETARYEGFFESGSDYGPYLYNNDFTMFGYAENELIMAEAEARASNLQPALDHLNNVRTNYLNIAFGAGNYTAYALSDFAPGGLKNPTTTGRSQQEALLREVLEEKFLCLFGEIETFNDIRRTNNLLGIPVNRVGASIPQRILYPQSEINANPNVPRPIPTMSDKTRVNQ